MSESSRRFGLLIPDARILNLDQTRTLLSGKPARFGCKEPPPDRLPSAPGWSLSLVLLGAHALPPEPQPCPTGCRLSFLAAPPLRPPAHHLRYPRPLLTPAPAPRLPSERCPTPSRPPPAPTAAPSA